VRVASLVRFLSVATRRAGAAAVRKSDSVAVGETLSASRVGSRAVT
jgi:hypothetical protein